MAQNQPKINLKYFRREECEYCDECGGWQPLLNIACEVNVMQVCLSCIVNGFKEVTSAGLIIPQNSQKTALNRIKELEAKNEELLQEIRSYKNIGNTVISSISVPEKEERERIEALGELTSFLINKGKFITELNLSDLGLDLIPKGLQYLNSLTNLHLNDNEIKKIENLPESLTRLCLYNNKITKIENLPNSLIYLSIHHNKIKKIENLPPSLKYLYLRNNQIEKIENLPKSLIELDLRNNQIEETEEENLPKSLRLLYLDLEV